MFSRSVIVFAALAAYHVANSLPKDIQADVHKAIGVYQDSVNNAIQEGSDKLNGLLEGIAVSSEEMEDIATKGFEENMEQAKKHIDSIYEQAKQEGIDAEECRNNAMQSFFFLSSTIPHDIRNCGSNARQQSQDITSDLLSTLETESYYKVQGFHAQYNSCIAQESSNCMSNLFSRIDSEAKDFPYEISLRVNQSAQLIGLIESGMSQCIDRAEIDATGQAEKISTQMQLCIG